MDWMTLSFFTQADCGFRPPDELPDFARAHHKPIMIAEAITQRYATGELPYSISGKDFEVCTPGQIWNEWYARYFAYAHDHADDIRAVAYIKHRLG